MAVKVEMPKMGYDMTEGTILSWSKHEGDPVAKGDVLGEIETGKVNIEIEAFDDGVLRKILVAPGVAVPVGTPIAIIGAADEPLDLPADAEAGAAGAAAGGANGLARPAPTAEVVATSSGTVPATAAPAVAVDGAADGGRLRASPLARRMAREHGLSLAGLAGSGPNGRVVRDDVRAALDRGPAGAAPAPAPAVPAAAGAAGPETREALSTIRRTIARRLSESWTAAPHIFVTMPIAMDAALGLRGQINAALAPTGVKVSVNDVVVKAVAHTLRRHPLVNVSWDDGARVRHDRVNIGVAVALDDGLITLTLPDADRRPISALAAEIADKAARAREGKLTPADLATPSTFTVSNLGMYGVEQFTAIINPPEACILAVGAAAPTAVVEDGQVAVRTMMKVTLSADHRVVDGAAAAEFLATLRETLENPLAMLV